MEPPEFIPNKTILSPGNQYSLISKKHETGYYLGKTDLRDNTVLWLFALGTRKQISQRRGMRIRGYSESGEYLEWNLYNSRNGDRPSLLADFTRTIEEILKEENL